MPSLIRLLIIIGLLVAMVYGAMLSIVSYVTPKPREMSHIIPPQLLNK
ncbi:MAG: oxidoreductase [Methylocystaceae bacterium]|nr:oxidoreductase [Methylocystaceae bacterium]